MMIFHNLPLLCEDARGTIRELFTQNPYDEENIQSILLIFSKASTVRSNHYHKTDSHYCYLLSGEAVWYDRPVAGGEIQSVLFHPGDMVYTPPMIIHAVRFLQDSLLLAFTTEPRDQKHYEDDTVRVELIRP